MKISKEKMLNILITLSIIVIILLFILNFYISHTIIMECGMVVVLLLISFLIYKLKLTDNKRLIFPIVAALIIIAKIIIDLL